MDYEQWHHSLQRGIQADSDGQVIQAIESYESLSGDIARCLDQLPSKVEQKLFQKLCDLLDARVACLSSVDGDLNTPELAEIQAVERGFADFLFKHANQTKPSAASDAADAVSQSSLPLSPPNAAATRLEIKVVRIGVKDNAAQYVNPTIRVSVYDANGIKLEDKPDLQVGHSVNSQCIEFGASVLLDTPLQQLRQKNGGIFLEFIHYKLHKRKQSCRCWALLEMDEVRVQEPSDATKSGRTDAVPLALEL